FAEFESGRMTAPWPFASAHGRDADDYRQMNRTRSADVGHDAWHSGIGILREVLFLQPWEFEFGEFSALLRIIAAVQRPPAGSRIFISSFVAIQRVRRQAEEVLHR